MNLKITQPVMDFIEQWCIVRYPFSLMTRFVPVDFASIDAAGLRGDAQRMRSRLGLHDVPVRNIMAALAAADPAKDELSQCPQYFAYSAISATAQLAKIYTPEKFMEDPYLQNIKLPDTASGKWSLASKSYKAFEPFMTGPPTREGLLSIPSIGCFTRDYSYMALQSKDKVCGTSVWMTVTPNETETMSEPIEHAHGKVLTLGLGIGYFAYMAHIKPDVESVTAIERDPDVIDMFTSHILPQFSHPEKITIVRDDAIGYLASLEDGKFDCCFADIWIGSRDIKPYLAVKKAGRHLKQTMLECWIEDSFLSMISDAIWSLILARARGSSEKAIQGLLSHANEHGRNIMQYADKLSENITFRTSGDIEHYTDPATVKQMVEQAAANP